MNHDPAFTRVRVRHELLPLLDDIAARDLVPVLCRQGALAADAVDALDALTESLDAGDAQALAGGARSRWPDGRRGGGCAHRPAATTRPAPRRSTGCSRWRGAIAVATEIEGGWRVARSHNRLHVTTAR